MDGFKLLEVIGLELAVPVISESVGVLLLGVLPLNVCVCVPTAKEKREREARRATAQADAHRR